jgi:hypothetical protein
VNALSLGLGWAWREGEVRAAQPVSKAMSIVKRERKREGEKRDERRETKEEREKRDERRERERREKEGERERGGYRGKLVRLSRDSSALRYFLT